jgi:hypothetical protein
VGPFRGWRDRKDNGRSWLGLANPFHVPMSWEQDVCPLNCKELLCVFEGVKSLGSGVPVDRAKDTLTPAILGQDMLF